MWFFLEYILIIVGSETKSGKSFETTILSGTIKPLEKDHKKLPQKLLNNSETCFLWQKSNNKITSKNFRNN
jgi:hypothetical protein